MGPAVRLGIACAGLLAAAVRAAPVSAGEPAADPTLVVLAAPRAGDKYYRPWRKQLLAFQTALAQAVMGRDDVVILADRPTLRVLARTLPDEVLLAAPMRDVWLRDFAPAMPDRPIRFRYSAAAQKGNQADADWVQSGFARFARRLGLVFRETPWILDGGNVVDNGRDQAIVTDRFLADNDLDRPRAGALLRELLGVERVAILPADPEDKLGHADGMVAFIASNTVAVTSYGGRFGRAVRRELRRAFPGVRLVELRTQFTAGGADPDFGSANGIYANAIVTDRFIYLPVYGLETDAPALAQIRAATDKEVVPIDARAIAPLGGSVRCLSAQMKGANARKVLAAARARSPR